jgi:hypothetical protein
MKRAVTYFWLATQKKLEENGVVHWGKRTDATGQISRPSR